MVEKMNPKRTLTIIVGGDPDADDDRLFNDPTEWETHPRNALYVRNYRELYEWLSPSKLDLLIRLITHQSPDSTHSVGTIARETKRKQEAISRDIHQLAKMNLVQLEKKGKNVLASTPFKSIQILFGQKA